MGHKGETLRKIKSVRWTVFMRKAMKHNEPNGNAGELMLELKMPSFNRGLYNLVRAALRLSDSNYSKFKRKIMENDIVIN